jgi:Mrp family chromosome partitioning ATPase
VRPHGAGDPSAERRPRQHRLFGLANETGASTVAVGEADLLSTLRPVDVVSQNGDGTSDFASWAAASDSVTKLWVLTSGPIPPNPGEIVASQRFAQMLKRLGEEADVVLVDSPAMLAVGDTAALASEVDGLVFLVDMEKARRPVLQAAAEQLYRLPCARMGLVVRLHSSGRGGRYQYYYRYKEDGVQRGQAPVATAPTPPTSQASPPAAVPVAGPTEQPAAGDPPGVSPGPPPLR